MYHTLSVSLKKSLLFFAFALLGLSSNAQVLINEYSCADWAGPVDAYGDEEDWIELYNTSAAPVNLAGWYLTDSRPNLTKWTFPSGTGTVIPANGRLIVWCSDKDVFFGSEIHTNFKLTQGKHESIILSDPSVVIVDSVTIKDHQINDSRGRMGDGAATWGVFDNPTFNTANTGAYDEYAPLPVFNTPAGFYPGGVTVSITCADPLAEIRYTTDGSEPTPTSTLYSASLTISATTLIRARSYRPSSTFIPSFIESNTYFIRAPHTMAVVSLGSNRFSTDFFTSGTHIISSYEFFNSAGVFETQINGEMRPHGNDSWAYDQKGMRIHTHDEFGYGNKIDYPFFNSSPRTDFNVLIMKPAGSDNVPGGGWLPSCHLRDAFNQTFAQKYNLAVDNRRWRPCVMYINGQYWGIYEIRERVDDDYTDYYYGQQAEDIDMIKHWGSTWAEYGSTSGWDSLVTYITTNDMTIPANYAYVNSQLDPLSLIDYFICNTFTVNSDWLNWNSMWWRGRKAPGVRWKYVNWDMDNTWDLGQNYTGLDNTDYHNDPCEAEDNFVGDPSVPHTDMFNALMRNTDFYSLYLNRYAEMLNEVYTCTNLNNHLDMMIDTLSPEMPDQIATWAPTMSMADWNANLAYMRSQIDGRCAYIDSAIADCDTVTGPFDLSLDVYPPGAGTVSVSSFTPLAYTWTGSYFGNVAINMAASATAGFVFDHWKVTYANSFTPDTLSNPGVLNLSWADSIVAIFVDTTTPIDTTPIDTTPIDTLPIDTLPIDTLPIDTLPIDTIPIDTVIIPPVDTEHIEPPVIIPGADIGIMAPTAFTPNNDGMNDFWRPVLSKAVINYRLIIYNRWGEKVFESTDYDDHWDGMYKEIRQPLGVYTWYLSVNYVDGKSELKSGNVTIIR